MSLATPALKRISDLPHPPEVPLLGSAHLVRPGSIHQLVEGWVKEFGAPMRMRFGRTQMLVVADHEALATALRERPDTFSRTPKLREVSAELGLSPGLFSAEGDAWRRQRRMVMASFAPGHIRAYFPAMAKVASRLQGRWEQAAAAGQDIDLQSDLMRYTVDTIAGLSLGADINTVQSGEDVIQQHLDKVLPALFKRVLSLVPLWRWFKREADRELERSVAVIHETIAQFVQQARQAIATDPTLREHPANLLQAMLAAADTPDSGLTDRDVVGNVLTMLLAGEDTTANTLAWMVYLLHRHPAALQRARAEARQALGPSAGQPNQFSLDTLDAMPFLDACINETMRLKPVAPFMALLALKDTELNGVAVPKNTLVWGVFRHDTLQEKHFAEPMAFEPGRWLDPNHEAGRATPHLQNHASAKRVAMPFGAGPRMCPGRYLALLEMKLAMAMLLTRFEIEAVSTPDGGEAEEDLYFTMAPKGLRMRLKALPTNP